MAHNHNASVNLTPGGKTVSPFSATMIGSSSNNSFQDARVKFREEAKEITQYIQGVHHSRKNPYSQVFYSGTVEKLSKFQGTVPVSVAPEAPKAAPAHLSRDSAARAMNEQQFRESMKQSIVEETFINRRKKLYNREVGRKAVINEVSRRY